MTYLTRIIYPSGSSTCVNLGSTTKLCKNLQAYEVVNKSAKDNIKLELFPETFLFMTMWQEFRDWYGKPMTCNSFYRTKSFNAATKGADPNSAHLKGCAFDCPVKLTAAARTKWANKWKEICEKHGVIGAINYYTNGIHLEAFSDQFYGNTKFVIRNYIGTKSDW